MLYKMPAVGDGRRAPLAPKYSVEGLEVDHADYQFVEAGNGKIQTDGVFISLAGDEPAPWAHEPDVEFLGKNVPCPACAASKPNPDPEEFLTAQEPQPLP